MISDAAVPVATSLLHGGCKLKHNSGPPRVWIWSIAIAKPKGLLRRGLLKAGDLFQCLLSRQLLQGLLVFRKSTGQKIACGKHICQKRLGRMQKASGE